MFQELLKKHLGGVLSRGLHSIDSGAIAIATDLGVKRTEPRIHAELTWRINRILSETRKVIAERHKH